jgi:hypothetical protein
VRDGKFFSGDANFIPRDGKFDSWVVIKTTKLGRLNHHSKERIVKLKEEAKRHLKAIEI